MVYPYKDIHGYIDALKKEGEFKEIDVPLKCGRLDTDMHGLGRYLQQINGPAVLCKNLVNLNTPGVPVLINLYGNLKRSAMIFGTTDIVEAQKKFLALKPWNIEYANANWPEPKMVNTGPCKDVIIKGDQVDILKQIPMVWFGGERQAYINGMITITKDPETGWRNVGVYRYGTMDLDPEGRLWPMAWEKGWGKPYPKEISSKCITSYYWWKPPMSHVGRHVAKAKNRGMKSLEVAIACVDDPTLFFAGQTTVPPEVDEYKLAGAIRGEPVELVKCETVDLEVPASAQYVLEGECMVDEEAIDGPHAGLYYSSFNLPVTHIKCITHVKNPIWYATWEPHVIPPIGIDHGWPGAINGPAELAELREKIPEIKNITALGFAGPIIIQLSVDKEDKPHPEFARYVMHAYWGTAARWGRTAKWIIVVGPDIDITNPAAVLADVAWRWQPITDSVLGKGQAMLLDYSAPKGPQNEANISEQMGMDATFKVPERFTRETCNVPSYISPEDVEKTKAKVKHLLEK